MERLRFVLLLGIVIASLLLLNGLFTGHVSFDWLYEEDESQNQFEELLEEPATEPKADNSANGNNSNLNPSGKDPRKGAIIQDPDTKTLFGEFGKNSIGEGCTNAWSIDKDCDGYGYGGNEIAGMPKLLGPDANDNDFMINTPESARKEFGGLDSTEDWQKYIESIGYSHKINNIYFVDIKNGLAQGEVNNVNKPWKRLPHGGNKRHYYPGDLIIYRGGEYRYFVRYDSKNNPIYEGLGTRDYQEGSGTRPKIGMQGDANRPILYMSYPGEEVIVHDTNPQFGVAGNTKHVHIIGFILNGNKYDSVKVEGLKFEGINSHITVKNLEVLGNRWGITIPTKPMKSHITLDGIISHDNPSEHGLYYRTEGDLIHSDLEIKNSMFYRNGRHAIQLGGNFDRVLVQNNIIHSNAMGCISLIWGVRESRFDNNLCFNNNKQGIILFSPAEPWWGAKPRPHQNNIFSNNLVWISGKYNNIPSSFSQPEKPWLHSAVTLNDELVAGRHNRANSPQTFKNNIFINNIFVTDGPPIFAFEQYRHIPETGIVNNLFWTRRHTTGNEGAMHTFEGLGEKKGSGTDGSHTSTGTRTIKFQQYPLYFWNFKAFQDPVKRPRVQGNMFLGPKFTSVSTEYSDAKDFTNGPGKFNFELLPNSPAVDKAVLPGSEHYDVRRRLRLGLPDLGPLENQYPVIESIEPQTIPASGNIWITIKGKNFDPFTWVKADTVLAPTELMGSRTAGEVRFFVPNNPPVGKYPIQLVNTNYHESNEMILEVK